MAGRRTPPSRRLYRRRSPLNTDVRTCGRDGVAKARWALDHPEPEQLTLEMSSSAEPEEREEANGLR